MKFPDRKHTRLKDLDYSQSGCYFVTVCVKNRDRILCNIIKNTDPFDSPDIILTDEGTVVEKYIKNIDVVYDNVSVDTYVIMPDHIHMLITINTPTDIIDGGMRASRPTLQTVIRSLKTMVTKEVGHPIWQESFYDHVIRNEKDHIEIWEYIDENPQKWLETGGAYDNYPF